ncbi:MAG: TRAP transporter large permease subunit [Alphaproteobacteria bacterium]|nr:MAG: TRAP transporter large permease subunit [Alphaproteobacteria bacterium]
MESLITILPLLMFPLLAVLLFTGYPVAFVLAGVAMIFGFIGMALGVFEFEQFFSIVLRIHGSNVNNLLLVAIPMFIFMGTMLEKSGVAGKLLDALQVLTRRIPGGLALSVMLLGVVMAASTGIIGASVVLMTLLALPPMLKRGYDPALATGTIVSSGTLGILIPPSIMLVIMGNLLSISVGTLFMAAIIPGLMLAVFYMIYILTTATLNPERAPAMPDEEGPKDLAALIALLLKSFLPPLALIVAVLGSIFAGYATPTEASGVGAFGAVLLALFNGKLTLPIVKDVLERSALTGAMLFGIFVTATAFSFVFAFLGGHELISQFVNGMDMGSWGILLILMAIVFLLGFFLDWIQITLIVLPIFAPIVGMMDFGDHVAAGMLLPWFAIMVAVNLQTSFLTPPFGFALFYLKGVAPKSIKIQQIYRGVIPFVLLQLLGLALIAAFPEIALWLPERLLD